MAEDHENDDLDLLLSLHQDRVLETPPTSPRYDSDHGSYRRYDKVDMSVFRNAVQDCLDYTPQNVAKFEKSKGSKDAEVEKFSGLRIRNQLVSSMELSNRLAEIRFVRLQAIKNVLNGDTLSGCWATIGILVGSLLTKKSSTGSLYCIWRIGCLDENTISVFMFGDAYTKYHSEKSGTIFGLFNCGVRKDNNGHGFSLSVYSAGQVLKIGTSTDYGICNGKKPDGTACTIAINKRRRTYCEFHKSKASQKYSVTRNELKGGNLRTAFRDFRQPEGVYMVNPDRRKPVDSKQPLKLLSVDCLKKALSKAGKVTTNIHSQGIRFLNEVTSTGKLGPKPTDGPQILSKHRNTENRIPSNTRVDKCDLKNRQQNAKRRKVEHKQTLPEKTKVSEKMIELDFVSSDEEM